MCVCVCVCVCVWIINFTTPRRMRMTICADNVLKITSLENQHLDY